MSQGAGIPFVVGQWVRGEKHYGRKALIEDVLAGSNQPTWLLGTRRVGKTSLLKQLEWLTASLDRGFFPLFWNLEGADDGAELHASLAEALRDVDSNLSAIGLAATDLGTCGPSEVFTRIENALDKKNLTLLLLCDETEELLTLAENSPAMLDVLRNVCCERPGVQTVLASSVRLSGLAERGPEGAAFFGALGRPRFLPPLSSSEALALIRQEQAHPDRQSAFSAEVAATIHQHCAGHPYLLQLLCKRTAEFGDVTRACDSVACDPMATGFFAVDFGMLTGVEQVLLRVCAKQSANTKAELAKLTSLSIDIVTSSGQRLSNLGLLALDGVDSYCVTNHFFTLWLAQNH